MKNLCIGLGLLVFKGILVNDPLMAATAKVTLKVVDDEGKPVAAFPVNAGFYAGDKFQGVTDTKGLFAMEGKAVHWEVNWVLKKDGYYRSQMSYAFKGGVKNDKWQPWNPTVIAVVRPVRNPIPMFMQRVDAMVPVKNEPFAFDLKEGDWVKPFGRGLVSDLAFQVTQRVTSANDYDGTLRLIFTNAFDGIQKAEGMIMESEFLFPRFAPISGYQTNYVYFHGNEPLKGSYGNRIDDPKKYYLIRLRSVLDSEGKLKEALYGSLAGEIELTGVASTNSTRIGFTYYLNPTPNDRNLEFDPARNLFHNLKPNEPVTWP